MMDHLDTESTLSEALTIPSQLFSQAISSVAPSVPADRTRNRPQRKGIILPKIPALRPFNTISALLV